MSIPRLVTIDPRNPNVVNTAEGDNDRTSPTSPSAPQSRITPNFSRPLPLSPADTASAPGNTVPIAGQFTSSSPSHSRPLPSVPDDRRDPSPQSLDHVHGGRGSGLGTRIIDDRDPDDLVIPHPQSRSPVHSYADDGFTSSAASDSELLYASAPSTPLHLPGELGEEIEAERASLSTSQITDKGARREVPERRVTVPLGGVLHDYAEGSVTPKRAATTSSYNPRTHQREMPVPQVPKVPEIPQHHGADDALDALEYSDNIDPYLRRQIEQFDDPKFPEPLVPSQTTKVPHLPESQHHLQRLVLGLPGSDERDPVSPQSDETVTMPMPSAITFPSTFHGHHESAWKSFASSSIHGPTFGEQVLSADTSQILPPPVIAGTSLEWEPLPSPHEHAALGDSQEPHAGAPSYGRGTPTQTPVEPPSHVHTIRPLPHIPRVSDPTTGGEGAGTFHEAGDKFLRPGAPESDIDPPTSAMTSAPIAPLRISKWHSRPSPSTAIPPGAAAATPPASPAPELSRRTRQLSGAKATDLAISSSPPSPDKQALVSEATTTTPALDFSGTSGTATNNDTLSQAQETIHKTNSGVLLEMTHGSSLPKSPKPAIKKSTGTSVDGLSSRASGPLVGGVSGTSHSEPQNGEAHIVLEGTRKELADSRPQMQSHSELHNQQTHAKSQSQEYKPHFNPLPSKHLPKPPPPHSDSSSNATPSGPRKRTSRSDTPSQQPRTLREEKAQYNAIPPSSRSQYMQMLLALDDIPMIYNLSASFFTWILLAGFILFPGTFTSLQTVDLGSGLGAALVNRIVNLPLFVIAFICTGIGVAGMGYLWWKWMKNYIWLVNKIFMPGLMNSLAGIISTLANVYGVQHGEFNKSSITTISVTGGVAAVCGILVLFYGVWMLGRVKKQHRREIGVEKAGKHGEGVWAGFKEKVGRVGKRT